MDISSRSLIDCGKWRGRAVQQFDSMPLALKVADGPIPAVHGVVRWRLVDLCQWMFEEHRVVVSTQTMSRELRAMSYRKLTARPKHHAQAAHSNPSTM